LVLISEHYKISLIYKQLIVTHL